jgi:hypothetical protein
LRGKKKEKKSPWLTVILEIFKMGSGFSTALARRKTLEMKAGQYARAEDVGRHRCHFQRVAGCSSSLVHFSEARWFVEARAALAKIVYNGCTIH